MILDNFAFEVLVDNHPLAEINLPCGSTKITTGLSYTLTRRYGNYGNDIQAFDTVNRYIVGQPNKKFKVRFYSTRTTFVNPMAVEVYIDGKSDGSFQTMKSCRTHFRDRFYSYDGSKEMEFSFPKSLYDDSLRASNDHALTLSRGGIGAISMYFYRARTVRDTNIYPFSVKQINKDANTQNLHNYHVDNYVTIKESNTPVAVLNLHYRPVSWFVERDLKIPIPNLLIRSIQNQRGNIKKDYGGTKLANIEAKSKNNYEGNNSKRALYERDIREIDAIEDVGGSSKQMSDKRMRIIEWLKNIE